ncbi:hypothetical protein ABW19_dt0209653 [Dactylella cylindrospora]|nr:hypothetical protein ABW19_dt0209653 [Dactylella cylindrospora]
MEGRQGNELAGGQNFWSQSGGSQRPSGGGFNLIDQSLGYGTGNQPESFVRYNPDWSLAQGQQPGTVQVANGMNIEEEGNGGDLELELPSSDVQPLWEHDNRSPEELGMPRAKAYGRCGRLREAWPPITDQQITQYNGFIDFYGFPYLGEPYRIDGTPESDGTRNPNYNFYDGFLENFRTGEKTRKMINTITQKISEVVEPVLKPEAKNYGCAEYKWDGQRERPELKTEDAPYVICMLRQSSALAKRISRQYGGRSRDGTFLWYRGDEYTGLDSIGYKALDWFNVSRGDRRTYHWMFRACGVRRPVSTFEHVADLLDMYIDVRIDIAARSPEELLETHPETPAPHAQVVVLLPIAKEKLKRWQAFVLRTTIPVPGYCLKSMLKSAEFPCYHRLYNEGIREAMWKELKFWQKYKDHPKAPQDTLPWFEDLEPVENWQRRSTQPGEWWDGDKVFKIYYDHNDLRDDFRD